MRNPIKAVIFFLILAPSLISFAYAQEDNTNGIIVYPALIEPTDTQSSYDLTIENKEDKVVTLELSPWTYTYKDGFMVPATAEEVSSANLEHIKIENPKATLQPGQKHTTKINFDPNSLPSDKYAGVMAKTFAEEKFQLNASIGSVILKRGIPSEEVLEIEIEGKPKITFTRDVQVEYSVKNNGRYLAKPSGEIEVIRNGESRVKGIQITSKINKNIFFDEKISDKINFEIPAKDDLLKENGKYDFKLTVYSSSGNTYSETSSVYYFNPLMIIVLIIIALLILIILLTLRKLLKRK